jgi:hypothetical protein
MAVFFTMLGILGSFEKKAEIIYSGEFFSASEFNFIELPNTLQYPSGNKISKTDRIQLNHSIQKIKFAVLEFSKAEIKSVAETIFIFLPFKSIFKFSLNTHAP